MNEHTSGSRRLAHRAMMAAMAALVASASAGGCNSITGVNDLTFEAAPVDGSGGGAGAAMCELTGFKSSLPTCAECITEHCCEQANDCTDDAVCKKCMVGGCLPSMSEKYLAFYNCASEHCAQCTNTGECAKGTGCRACCATKHPVGAALFQDDLLTCRCEGGVCGSKCTCSKTDVSTECGGCLNEKCIALPKTTGDADGRLYLGCVNGCNSGP